MHTLGIPSTLQTAPWASRQVMCSPCNILRSACVKVPDTPLPDVRERTSSRSGQSTKASQHAANKVSKCCNITPLWRGADRVLSEFASTLRSGQTWRTSTERTRNTVFNKPSAIKQPDGPLTTALANTLRQLCRKTERSTCQTSENASNPGRVKRTPHLGRYLY